MTRSRQGKMAPGKANESERESGDVKWIRRWWWWWWWWQQRAVTQREGKCRQTVRQVQDTSTLLQQRVGEQRAKTGREWSPTPIAGSHSDKRERERMSKRQPRRSRFCWKMLCIESTQRKNRQNILALALKCSSVSSVPPQQQWQLPLSQESRKKGRRIREFSDEVSDGAANKHSYTKGRQWKMRRRWFYRARCGRGKADKTNQGWGLLNRIEWDRGKPWRRLWHRQSALSVCAFCQGCVRSSISRCLHLLSLAAV